MLSEIRSQQLPRHSRRAPALKVSWVAVVAAACLAAALPRRALALRPEVKWHRGHQRMRSRRQATAQAATTLVESLAGLAMNTSSPVVQASQRTSPHRQTRELLRQLPDLGPPSHNTSPANDFAHLAKIASGVPALSHLADAAASIATKSRGSTLQLQDEVHRTVSAGAVASPEPEPENAPAEEAERSCKCKLWEHCFKKDNLENSGTCEISMLVVIPFFAAMLAFFVYLAVKCRVLSQEQGYLRRSGQMARSQRADGRRDWGVNTSFLDRMKQQRESKRTQGFPTVKEERFPNLPRRPSVLQDADAKDVASSLVDQSFPVSDGHDAWKLTGPPTEEVKDNMAGDTGGSKGIRFGEGTRPDGGRQSEGF